MGPDLLTAPACRYAEVSEGAACGRRPARDACSALALGLAGAVLTGGLAPAACQLLQAGAGWPALIGCLAAFDYLGWRPAWTRPPGTAPSPPPGRPRLRQRQVAAAPAGRPWPGNSPHEARVDRFDVIIIGMSAGGEAAAGQLLKVERRTTRAGRSSDSTSHVSRSWIGTE